jgi:HAD superfamily phosphoserine phosphatase-like hydrolase
MTPASSLSQKAAEFVDSVLRLRPSLAVFDCDGTLWSGDVGEDFFDWELQQGVFPEDLVRWARQRYADYQAGMVDQDTMCGEMVTLHRGLPEAKVQELCTEFFEGHFRNRIFPELQHLIRELQSQPCDVWMVSSSNEWIIKASMKHFGIPDEKILAAAVQIDAGIVTDRLVRVPSGAAKPEAIRMNIGRVPDVAFGNSRWDTEMLQMSRQPFVVNPFADLEAAGRKNNWPIYWPDGMRA